MPPKKKARVSQSDVPVQGQAEAPASSARATPALAAPAAPQQEVIYKPGTDPESLVADQWSAEQETALLKGIIRWKPVGLHKHFRMLAISDYLRSQGYSPSREPHTRIPNIWRKLETLYNLAGLDEREDTFAFDGSDDSEEENGLYCPFELPEEFSEMMFERRLAPDGQSSPPVSMAGGSVRGSTRAGTDEPRSSPVTTRGRGRPVRGTRQSARSTHATRLQATEASRNQSREKTPTKDDDGTNDEADSDDGKTEMDDEDENATPAASQPPTRKKAQAARGKGKKTRAASKRGRKRG